MARKFFVLIASSKGFLNMINLVVSFNAGHADGARLISGGPKSAIIVFTSACSKLLFASLSYIAFTWQYLRRNSCRSFPYPTSSHEFEVMKQNVPLSLR